MTKPRRSINTIMSSTLTLLLTSSWLLGLCFVSTTSSFSISSQLSQKQGSTSVSTSVSVGSKSKSKSILFTAASSKSNYKINNDNNNDNQDNANKIKMTFEGSHVVSTSSLPYVSTDMLIQFYNQEQYRNLLFPNNNAVTLPSSNITPELLRQWCTQNSKSTGGVLPIHTGISLQDTNTQKHSLIEIEAKLHMPGLNIISKSTIGVILLLPALSSSNDQLSPTSISFPEYQFTLLDTQLIPSGPKPLVWLFQQVVKYRDTTDSFTRVMAQPTTRLNTTTTTTQTQTKIQFITKAKLETKMHLPSTLNRILPTSLSKFEKQGSEAIQKMLEKDLGPALNHFADAYAYFVQDELSKINTTTTTTTTTTIQNSNTSHIGEKQSTDMVIIA